MRGVYLLASAPLAFAAVPAMAQHAGHVAPSEAKVSAPTAEGAADVHAGHVDEPDQTAAGRHGGHAMGADADRARAGRAAPKPPSSPDAHAMPRAEEASATGRHARHVPPDEDPAESGANGHAGHERPAGGGPGGDPPKDGPADPHAGHDMSGMPAMDHAAMGHGATADGGVGDAPAPPPPPADRWADRYYGVTEMDTARAIAGREHGGGRYRQILFNLAEYQARKGRDGYRWDGEGWYGGDIDRLTIKTEGEGRLGQALEAAEVQALWSHAIDAYWNVQSGVRVDVRPGPSRAYATLAVEGLAPYWFDVEGGLFLSDKGDLLGRFEAWYDQRITQRLFLQPRVELNLAAQDVPESVVGAGLVNAELGLRLRYELAREFAPYVGLSWERRVGATARYARAAGEGAGGASFVAGVRFWF